MSLKAGTDNSEFRGRDRDDEGDDIVKTFARRWAALGLCLLMSTSMVAAEEQQTQGPKVVQVAEASFTAPADWYSVDIPRDKPNVRTILASNEEPAEQALMLVSVLPKQGRTLEALVQMNRNYVLTRMAGQILNEGAHEVAGSPARTMVYQGRSEYFDEQGRRTFSRTIVDRGDKFYVFHGITEPDTYSKHKATIEGIVKSVKWDS